MMALHLTKKSNSFCSKLMTLLSTTAASPLELFASAVSTVRSRSYTLPRGLTPSMSVSLRPLPRVWLRDHHHL